MSNLRYSELKYDGKIYTEQWKIDEILVENKFNWLVNAEIKNSRIEIFEDTIVWNGGIWYNGNWFFGVWRDGEWRYGKWENGVWYGGTWRDGIFKTGIIYKGNFFKGKIEGGEIRGGKFIDIEIAPEVIEYTEDEFQLKKEKESEKEETITEPVNQDPDKVTSKGTPPAIQQIENEPSIQQEKNNYKKNITYNMKTLKKFNEFVKESVGELEDSFIDINIDKTDLEMSEKPSGKLKQKTGKVIIENPSKTDEYNAKMRLGGDTIVDPEFNDEKTILNVKKTK